MRAAALRGIHHGLIASGGLTLACGAWFAYDYLHQRRKDARA